MIRINLATKKISLGAAGLDQPHEDSAIGGILGKFSIQGEGASPFAVLGYPVFKTILLYAVIGVAVWVGLIFFKDSEVNKVTKEIEEIKTQTSDLRKKLSLNAKEQATMKSLEESERVLNIKIQAVKTLMNKRDDVLRVLQWVATATPKELWIEDMTLDEFKLELSGSATDFAPISDFMKSIGQSASLTDLKIENTQLTKDQEGMEITQFKMTAMRK